MLPVHKSILLRLSTTLGQVITDCKQTSTCQRHPNTAVWIILSCNKQPPGSKGEKLASKLVGWMVGWLVSQRVKQVNQSPGTLIAYNCSSCPLVGYTRIISSECTKSVALTGNQLCVLISSLFLLCARACGQLLLFFFFKCCQYNSPLGFALFYF